jgi:spore coat protein U-like protein
MTTAETGQTVSFAFRRAMKSATNYDGNNVSSIFSLKFLSEPTETGGGYNKTRHRPGKETEEVMRKSMTVFIALAVLAAGGAAWASDSNTLAVSANVTGTCKFTVANSTLNFGALDPSTPVAVNGSANPQFWCTKGVTTDLIVASFGQNPAGTTRQMRDSVSTDLIPYSLTLTPDGLANGGPSVTRTLNIAGTVLAADYTGKSAGSYSDTVTLTLTP